MTSRTILLIGAAAALAYGVVGSLPQSGDVLDTRIHHAARDERSKIARGPNDGTVSRRSMASSRVDSESASVLESSVTHGLSSRLALQDLEFNTQDPGWDYVDMDEGPPVGIGEFLDPDDLGGLSPDIAANAPTGIGFYLDPDDTASRIGVDEPVEYGAYLDPDDTAARIGVGEPVEYGAYLDPDEPPADEATTTPVQIGTYLDPDFPSRD